jgi:hypothetical protein
MRADLTRLPNGLHPARIPKIVSQSVFGRAAIFGQREINLFGAITDFQNRLATAMGDFAPYSCLKNCERRRRRKVALPI